MEKLFVLHHVNRLLGIDHVKLIGIYSSLQSAQNAVDRVNAMPGFKEHLDGFRIDEYEVNKTHWVDGFVSIPKGVDLDGNERQYDIPLWAKGKILSAEENGKQAALKLCNARFGAADFVMGTLTEFEHIRKFAESES